MEPHSNNLELSVILCTYNPRRDILAKALDAVDKQTLPKSRWEFIVIDNNSSPALTEKELNKDRTLPLRLLQELRQGNVFARQTGLAAAKADILLFVDDDNIMDPDYFETALKIAAREPKIGAFGGISRGILEGGPVSGWKKKLLPFLGVRDYGPNVQTSFEDKWGEWEPIGAGMVFRRDVGLKYVEMVSQIMDAHTLGRKGKGLMAGEDSLLARATYRLGYACSYQPGLKFDHYIKKSRLKTSYLARLLHGHGRSVVNLNRVLGLPNAKLGLSETFARLFYRMGTEGRAGLVWWCWDIGYYTEMRKKNP